MLQNLPDHMSYNATEGFLEHVCSQTRRLTCVQKILQYAQPPSGHATGFLVHIGLDMSLIHPGMHL